MGKDKQVKSVGDFDRISNFPDPILDHILSFLPAKDAVRSSVLSSRWRYLYTSMSTIDFDDCLSYVPKEYYSNFKDFVDRLLLNPKQHVDLECFRLNDRWWIYSDFHISICRYLRYVFQGGDDVEKIPCDWLCAVLRRGVKKIVLILEKGDIFLNSLSASALFTCQSLVTLELSLRWTWYVEIPSNICLPNLKTLRIKRLVCSDFSPIIRLISGCHILEDLSLTPCWFEKKCELNIHSLSLKRLVLYIEQPEVVCNHPRDHGYVIVINAPSLVYFKYLDKLAEGYTLSDMKSLEKADIRIKHFDWTNREQSAIDLLQGVCNVQSLYLTVGDYESLFWKRLDPVLVFHNLVELKFHSRRPNWKGTWLVDFLHSAPNLKTLVLDLAVWDEGIRLGALELPEEVPSCLSFHLKEIQILHFEGDTHMFELISYFLDNAMVLEKLKIGIEETFSKKEQFRIFRKLSSLPRNSKTCRLLTF